MTIKGFSVRALAGAAFTLLSFVPNNVVPLTPVAFAQDQTVSSSNTARRLEEFCSALSSQKMATESRF
jgi:hypothetical protein